MAGLPGVGLQLYSVRGELARDFAGTLERVGGLGVEGVELGFVESLPAEQAREALDAAELSAISTHVFLEQVEENGSALYAQCELLGHHTIVVTWIAPPETAAEASIVLERLEKTARLSRACGFDLLFHNHDGEFRALDDGTRFIDRLLAEAPTVQLELDLGWAWMAGEDIATLMAAVAGRCPIVHVKDFASRVDSTSFVAVGEGSVPFIDAFDRGATPDWLIAEQDDNFVPDELGAAARSCQAVLDLRDQLAAAVR